MEIWRKKRVKQIREETDIDKEEREKEKLVKYYRHAIVIVYIYMAT